MTSIDIGLGSADHEVLRRIELQVTRRLDGLLHGDYRGLVPGQGSEAGEAREYAPGDDVGHMDWNVTARTTVPHIREMIADRELERLWPRVWQIACSVDHVAEPGDWFSIEVAAYRPTAGECVAH